MGGRRLSAGLLAAGGVVAGHVLTYALAVPDPHERLEVLASTGHGYWSEAAVVAVAAVIGALALWISEGLPARDARGWAHLVLLQSAGFTLMEISERFVSAGHLSGKLLPILVVGIGCQMLVAALIVSVLGLARLVVTRTQVSPARPRVHLTWSSPLTSAPLVLRGDLVFNRIVASLGWIVTWA